MTSQPGKQTIAIHTLSNISRIKDNQAMKFGQLIEYDMKNTFLKNHTQNVVKKKNKKNFFWRVRVQL